MKSVFLYVDETTENKENFGLEESERTGEWRLLSESFFWEPPKIHVVHVSAPYSEQGNSQAEQRLLGTT